MSSRRNIQVPYSLAASIAFFAVFAFSNQGLSKDKYSNRIGPNTTLSFEEKRAELSTDSKQQLDALMKEAKSNGKISEIQVAAWSDNPAPRDKEKLSKTDRDLADDRADAIQTYLKSRAKVSMSSYNMADRSSWLARALNTTESELKTEIGHGGEQPLSKREFQVFKDNGQPSRAVVLVILKR